MTTIPRIISVDDHVVEPPDLWTSRLPAKYQDRCPRIERDTAKFNFEGGIFSFEKGVEGGEMCDWWLYDDLVYPFPKLSAAVGFDELDVVPVTFDEIHPAGWKQADRLAAMDENHVDVSVCFPNVLPRFCGQAFLEREDKDLALLCVQAYNDWIIDEWCAGDGRGRLIPLTLIPLWDPVAAAAEVHRCADKGSFAVAFSENPFPLGLPSIHDKGRFWDPFFVACQETDTIVNMHIGSSSKMPTTSPDAPFSVSSTITFANAMGSMCDYILSGMFVRFPKLKIAYAEGQVGWMPYVVERMDKIWAERGDASFGIDLPEPPSSYIPGHVWGCIFDDEIGLKNRDVIGLDQICFEVDFPHADTTYPHTLDVATKICREAGLDDDEVYKLMRGNAIKAFGLERFGITE
ncbi:MAG: amidohydrolase family protein [Actinomycetota bacterium]|nr:amidohydrolase family protein [Actinomycetota bacterium]